MTPSTKLFLKLLAMFGVIFAVFAGLPAVAICVALVGERALPVGIAVSIPVVACIAVVIALATWATQIYAVRQLGCTLTDENLQVAQERTIIVNCGYEEATARAVAAVQSLRNVRILDESPEGVIAARTGLTWRSWGENIRVRLRRKSDDWTMITVSSQPKLGATLLDQGQNLKNVRQLVEKLAEETRGRS
jgi:hypothetical protein